MIKQNLAIVSYPIEAKSTMLFTLKVLLSKSNLNNLCVRNLLTLDVLINTMLL